MIFAGKGEKTAAPTLASRVTAASARQTGSGKSVSTQKEKAESSSSGGIGTQLLNGFYSILFLILILIIGVIALGVSKSYTTNNLEQTPSERVDTPDFSGISDSDRTGIIEACKDQGSPANVYRCQKEELSKLKRIGAAPPDMSDISAVDRAGIIDACKGWGSPADVYFCQREKLSMLRGTDSASYMDDISDADRAGIIDICRYRGSLADDYSSCQRKELNKLRRTGPAPDMSDISDADRARIIDACRNEGSPADVYSCQGEELSKLRRF